MTDLAGVRTILQEEEVKFKASVSEATFTRVAQASNFISQYQFDSKAWFLNGPYHVKGSSQFGVDGAYIAPFNMEIVGFAMYNLEAGTGSNPIELQIQRWTDSGVSDGEIFFIKPALFPAAGNNAYLAQLFLPTPVTLVAPGSGFVEAELDTGLTVDQGHMLTLDITSAQDQGRSAGLVLWMRPR